MRGNRFKALSVLAVALSVLLGGPVAAAQTEEEVKECGADPQRGYGLCLGYEGLSIDGGGETVLPYRLLDSHAVARGFYQQPLGEGLIDLTFSYDGEDYYRFNGEFYGTTDTVTLRSQKFVRNLEHRNLPGPFDTSTSPLYWSEDLNPDDEYGLDHQEHYAAFKYKWHTYPANVAVAMRRYTSEGEKQQLFLNENCTTNCHNISQTRKVKKTTDQVFLNGTVHVGLVDVSYHYKGVQFSDDMADPVYSFGSISSFSGTWDVHNTYPDMESAEHLVSISTNHTGRVSGLLTLGVGDRENRDSDVSESYQTILGRFFWRPGTALALFLDSRQVYQQDDRPGSAVTAARLADGAPLRYGSVQNRHRLTVNYYPLEFLDLKGEVLRSDTEREDNELWGLPDETTSDEWRLTARLRPASKVRIKAAYSDRSTDDPAYRTSPTESRKWHLAGRWNPVSTLSLDADLRDFADRSSGSGLVNDRRIIGAGVTYTPKLPVSLALRVHRFTNDISADLTFVDAVPTPIAETDVPYEAEGTQYMIQAAWNAGKKLLLTGRYSYLQAEGSYDTSVAGFDDLGDYSGLDAVQQESSLDMTYTLSGGWGLAARLAKLTYEDKGSDLEDEDVSEVAASVTRRW